MKKDLGVVDLKKTFYILLLLIFCILACPFGIVYAETADAIETEDILEETVETTSQVVADIVPNEYTFKTLKGTVLEAGEVYEESDGYDTYQYQDVKVHIKDQGYNTTKLIKHSLSYYNNIASTDKPLKKGDKVYVYSTFTNGQMSDTQIFYRNNTGYVIMLILAYAIAILLVGRMKGVKALVSLILTVLAVFYIILPQIIGGANPVFITILVCAGITIVTILIIAGFNKKALAAILGTIGGIIIAGIFALLFGNLMALSGVTEEALYLIGGTEGIVSYDFRGILFAGIIIGALGAVMDVSMSIASALQELREENEELSVKKMIKAGMNIGKDVMGTMTNTLILAYTGGSLILIMIFMSNGWQLFEVINQEMMLEEILRAVAGSFGLVATIPFTTLVSSLLMGRK